MPQVKNVAVTDGFYKNVAVTPDGKPRQLSLGTISFKPDQVRFVPARVRLESRFTNQAFEQALANENLVGPAPTAEELTGAAHKKVDEPPPPAVENQPPVEPEPVVAEEPAPEPVAADDKAPSDDDVEGKKKRRRRK